MPVCGDCGGDGIREFRGEMTGEEIGAEIKDAWEFGCQA